ncbi:MAG TPA: lycopene cyclase domain-containing protein [Thermoanaerobaculia bacterium]|nr:lycopene cyclase domain-containing protein [Thermoanaerobaculia bacterium]
MIPDAWVWTMWSFAFLIPWAVLYARYPRHRRSMLWASVFTAPFGLTEPLFVPEYWNPPSLFDLAQTTGFDLESLVFCFGIGGVGAVLYNVATGRRTVALPDEERRHSRHRFHRWVLAAPFLVFAALLPLGWNPIYPGILAMFGGAVATVACRPDLRWNVALGGFLFLAYYLIFLVGLEVTAPGYVERVWNLDALSGIRPLGLPIEELLFGLGFGAYWAGVYEHFTWRAARPRGHVADAHTAVSG